MSNIVLVGVGGAIGAILRYTLGVQVQEWVKPASFPYGTLFLNLTGCFLIGLVYFLLSGRGLLGPYSLFFITGILGGYTTFSAFGLELFTLLASGSWAAAGWYVLLSNAAGLLAVWLGRVAALRLG